MSARQGPRTSGKGKKKSAIPQNLHLADAPIDLNTIRENHRKYFKKIMDKIRGPKKMLLLKKDMLRLLNLVVGGVVKIATCYLDENTRIDSDVTNVVYLVWPDVSTMNLIVNQISAKRGRQIGQAENRKYHIIMIPNCSIRCKQVLERNELLNQVEIIEFPLDLIPLDRDLITCGLPNLLSSAVLSSDYQPLNQLAKALLKIEIMFGRFKERRAKGRLSRTVIELMDRFKRESDELLVIHDQPEVDQLILFDRLADPISVLMTQRTYEGIINEVHGIHHSTAEFDEDVVGKVGQGKVKDGKKRMMLNSADRIFKECRNMNSEFALGPWCTSTGKTLSKFFNKRHEASQNIQSLKAFIGGLGTNSDDHLHLGVHINIATSLSKVTNKYAPWKRQMKIENELLECGALSEDPEEYILELCVRGASFHKVLRMMCLTSLTRGGLRKFDIIRREVMQSFGYVHMLTLQKMQKVGLIQSKQLLSSFIKKQDAFDYANLKKFLSLYTHLTPEDYKTNNEGNLGLRDLNTIGSGYAPISSRVVQMLHAIPRPDAWLEKLNVSLPGSHYSRTVPEIVTPTERPKRIMVCFVGGVTHAEISAIRLLEKRNPEKFQFIILASSITDGTKFVDQFVCHTAHRLEELLEQERNRHEMI